MNFKQKVIILGSIICSLIVLYVLGSVITNTVFRSEYTQIFTEVNTDDISSVSISDMDGKADLVKTGDTWQVSVEGSKFPGDSKNIMQLIHNIAALKKNRTASTRAETFAQFQVDPENAVHAVFSGNNNTKMDIYFGKSGEDGYSQYVRLEGSNEVIQTVDRILFSSRTREWVDTKVFQEPITIGELESIVINCKIAFTDSGHIDPDTTSAIRYTINHSRVDNKSVFSVAEDPSRKISIDAANQLIFAIYSFKAEDVVTDPENNSIDTAAPLATVTLNLSGGRSYTLTVVGIVEESTTTVYIKNPATPYFYTAMSWNINKIIPSLKSLTE